MHDDVQVKSDRMLQTHIANTLNASINDVCEARLIQATKRLGEGPVLDKFHASEVSLKRLLESKLPDYSGLDPVVYAIWYHACHVAMSYKIFRTLIDRTRFLITDAGPSNVVRILDVGCGTHAGLFGLTLAVASAIERREDIPKFQFHSIDPCPDMPKLGRRLWSDFLDKTCRTRVSGLIENALKRIRLTETKSSIHELDLQTTGAIGTRQNWLLAMHVVYDETIDELRETFRNLSGRFDPDIGVLTSHYANTELLTQLYPFSGNQFKNEDLIEPIESGRDYLEHWSKERNRSNKSLEDVLAQIRKRGYLHRNNSKCPSGAVIRILRKVSEPSRPSASSPSRMPLKPARDSFIAPRHLRIASVVNKPKNRNEPSGCAVGDHDIGIVPSSETSTIGVCRLCGTRYSYHKSGAKWVRGPLV